MIKLMIWLYSLASVILVSLMSLVGVFTLSLHESRLRKIIFVLVALSVGALFGDVFIHLLPEILEEASSPASAMTFVLLGILIFFILEKFLRWGHHHAVDEHDQNHQHIKPVGPLNLVSDGLHNFIDGIIIGVSFLASPAIGFATTIAVILHEIPQEIGDFGLLLHAGFTKKQAITFNLLSASLALIGVIIALVVGETLGSFIEVMLPVAAGGFIYIAGSDLVPELHKTLDLRKSLLQFAAILLGIGLMMLLLLLE